MKGRRTLGKEEIKKLTIRNAIILILKIFVILAMFFLIFTMIFGIIRVRSDVMAPSIRDGDLLIYYRIDRDYKAGEVVVCEINNKKYILRIAGVPGDYIEIDKEEGKLLVNSTPEEHISYYSTIKDDNKKIKYPYRVGKNEYFLINDYHTFTDDSRKFGSVSEDKILGKVIGKLQTRNI